MPRDPYPFPALQNDNDFCTSKQVKLSGKETKETTIRSKCENKLLGKIEFPARQLCSSFLILTQVPYNRDGTVQAQHDEPWSRLYGTKTLSSSRREVCHHDPQAPHDSLDFVIKSKYDHHQEFLKSKAETLFQPETLGLPHGRVLKNRSFEGSKSFEKLDSVDPFPVISISEKKENIHSTNGAIPSHHSAATNRGYSRKHDGGFYTC